MRQAAGIDDDESALLAGCVDAVDDGALMIGLEVAQLQAQTTRLGLGGGLDVVECGAAVDGGLAGAEEVEVGAVDEEDAFGHCSSVFRRIDSGCERRA